MITHKFPINKSKRVLSEISTKTDIDEVVYSILKIVELKPSPAKMIVGNDGNIAYGYRSSRSEIPQYGSLETVEVIYSKVIACRVKTDDNAYVIFSEQVPFSSVEITYDGSQTVSFPNSGDDLRFETVDSGFATYIIGNDGNEVDLSFKFIR